MKYFIDTIRRRSKNNGINICQYWVVVNSETGEIVYDGNYNINQKDSESRAQGICDKLNDGSLKTRTFTRLNGTKGECINWFNEEDK